MHGDNFRAFNFPHELYVGIECYLLQASWGLLSAAPAGAGWLVSAALALLVPAASAGKAPLALLIWSALHLIWFTILLERESAGKGICSDSPFCSASSFCSSLPSQEAGGANFVFFGARVLGCWLIFTREAASSRLFRVVKLLLGAILIAAAFVLGGGAIVMAVGRAVLSGTENGNVGGAVVCLSFSL